MEPELRRLRTVRAIADTGSLTKAAAALGLAQPAPSAQLRRIEKALGGPLFARDRGARPTLLGELVLERGRVVLPAVSELQEEAVRFTNAWGAVERFRRGGTHGPRLGGLVDRGRAVPCDVPADAGRGDAADDRITAQPAPSPGPASPLRPPRRRPERRADTPGGVHPGGGAQRQPHAPARRAPPLRRRVLTAAGAGYRAPCPGATASTLAARARSFSVTFPPASCEFTESATVL